MGNPTLLLYLVTALVLAAIGYYAFRPVPQMSEHYAEEATIIPPVEVPVDLNPFTCNAEGVCFRSDSPTHVEVASKDPKKRFKVHAGVDMMAPLTINGNVVATAADVEKVRFPGPKGDKGDPGNDGVGLPGPAGRDGIDAVGLPGPQGPSGKDAVGLPGKDGMDGMDGKDGKDGADGKNGANFAPAVMQEGVKTNKLQLGNKFLLSGVGDAHANDDWLRMFDKDGKGYNGGFAAGRLWTPSLYSNSAGTNFMGGTSAHNPNKWGTHLPWHGDNKNYIRGDTEMRGNTNNIGSLAVGGAIVTNHVAGDPARQSGRLHVASGERLYLLPKDGVIVGKEWGGNGNLSVQGQLCVGSTCITDADMKRMSGKGANIIDIAENDYRLLDNLTDVHRITVNNTQFITVPTKMTAGVYEVTIFADGGDNLDPHLYPMNTTVRTGDIHVSYTYTDGNNNKRSNNFAHNMFWWDNYGGGAGSHGMVKFTIYNLSGMYKRVLVEMGDTAGAGTAHGVWYKTDNWDWIGRFRLMVGGTTSRQVALVKKIV